LNKNILIAVICLAGLAGSAQAQKYGDTGVGVVLGAPTGVTGKLWLDETQAFDAGLGWNNQLTVYGDYLWHGWNLLPQPAQGKMPVYLGLGAQARMYSDTEFGIRGVVGIAYWLPRDPIELFAEIVPIFHISRNVGMGVDGAIGARYYFH
jgi:hypothetical protein